MLTFNGQNMFCPVCGGECSLLDVVDFNKSCEEFTGKFLPLSGVPIYYALCEKCAFCFAPQIMSWSVDQFAERIYNNDYQIVDPEYAEIRPRTSGANLIATLGGWGPSIRHLDYGGGNGMLSRLLRESNWQSISYDPFVDKDLKVESLGKFDLISAFEVFEHVPNVNELLATLRSLLAENGMVFFSTALTDGNILPHRRLGWWYAAPRNGHISLYSKMSLEILSRNYGLNLKSFGDAAHVLYTNVPPWASHMFV